MILSLPPPATVFPGKGVEQVDCTPPATLGLPGGIARFINPLSQLSNGTTNDPFAPCSSTSNSPFTTNATSNHSLPPMDPFSPRPKSSEGVSTNVSRIDPFAPIASSEPAGVKATPNNASGKLTSEVWDFREEAPTESSSNQNSSPLRVNMNSGTPRVTINPECQTNGVTESSDVVTVSSDSRINIVPPASGGRHAAPPSASDCSSVSISSSNPILPKVALTKHLPKPVNCLSKAPTTSSINTPLPSSQSNPVSPSTVVLCRPTANSKPTPCKPNLPSVVLCKPTTNSSVQGPPKPTNSSVNVITSSTQVSSSNVPVPSSSVPSKAPPVVRSRSPPARVAPSAAVRPTSASSVPVGSNRSNVVSPLPGSASNVSNGACSPKPRRNSTSNDGSSCNDANSNNHAGNLYEHLFLATDPLPSGSTGNTAQENSSAPSGASQVNNSARSRPATRTTVNPQPNRPRKRSTSNSESSGHLPNVPADRIRVVSQRQVSQPSQPITRHGPVSPPTTQCQPSLDTPLVNPSGLTLREQQVLQLRREMMHPGGVRLQLRRKDCVSSIALVDAFNAVW
ncbi:hypothetical protein WDU94_013382 [Cyamophila willieti]